MALNVNLAYGWHGRVKVGPLSLHSRSCLVLSQTDSGSGSNTRVLTPSRLQLLEDAAMTANIPSKLMVQDVCSCRSAGHPLATEVLQTVMPSEALPRRTPLSAV